MSTPPREIGTLIAVILKARNLPNKRHIGKQDPYCVVQLNGEKRRTKAIKRGGQHPEWDEEIRFTVYEGSADEQSNAVGPGGTPPPPPPKKGSRDPPDIQGGRYMLLSCYAEDLKEPDFIGEARVDLGEVLTKGETDEWFTLMNRDKYSGEIYLELTFWSNEPAPVKKPSMKAKTKRQYGGPGTFMPSSEGRASSESLNSSPQPSRWSMYSSGSWSQTSLNAFGSSADVGRNDIRPDALPPSLRASSSITQIGLYRPNYETASSHTSSQSSISQQNTGPTDALVNELGQMNLQQGLHRRMSLPQMSINDHLRSTSASVPYLHPQSTGFSSTASAYGAEGASHDHERSSSGNTIYSSYQAPAQENTYYPSYEPPSRAQSVHTGHPRARLSLPSSSSGFIPLQNNSISAYGQPMTQQLTYQAQSSATPAPSLYRSAFQPISTAPTPAPTSYAPMSAPTPGPAQFSRPPPSSAYPSQQIQMPTPSASLSAISQYNPPQQHIPQSMSYQSVPRSPSVYNPPYAIPSSTSSNAAPQYNQAPSMTTGQRPSAPPQSQYQQQNPQMSRPQPMPPSNMAPGHSLPQVPSPTQAHSHVFPGQMESRAYYGAGNQIPPPPPLNPSPSHGQVARPLPEVPNGPSPLQRHPNMNIPPPPPLNGSVVQPPMNFTSTNQIPPPPPLSGPPGVSPVHANQPVPPPPPLPNRRRLSYHAGQQPPELISGPPPSAPIQRAPSAQAMYHNAMARQNSTGGGHPLPSPPTMQAQYSQQQPSYQIQPPPRPPSYAPAPQMYQGVQGSTSTTFSSSQYPSAGQPGSLPMPPKVPQQQYSMHNGEW